MIRPTLEKCVVVGQLLDTRSLGGQLLVCGPLGLLDFVFRAFGRSGRVTHAYVSMMHVSMMHVSMIHVSMMYVPVIHHMGPEDPSNRKKTPIFFVDAKFSQIARGFQKSKS